MNCFKYILVSSLVVSTHLYSASFRDSGTIYRQIKDDTLRNVEQKKMLPKVEVVQKEKIQFDDSHKIYVKGFHVVGNEHLTESELHTIMQPFIHVELSTTQLHEAANTLMLNYREKGYFAAKVYIPPHSIHDGIVTLHVYEGHLEENGIELKNSDERVKSEKVLDLLNNTLKPGIMIKDDYERAILLTDDFPGINAKATIYPGKEVGTARFMIETQDEEVFNGNIDIDNFGNYYTGENRLGTTLYFNSPTKNGEELVARLVTTGKYSNFGYVDLAVPILDNGTRFGFSVDYLKYKLDHQIIDTNGRGNAWDARAYFKYPFIRTRHLNIEGEVSYVHTELVDKSDLGELANRKLNKGIFRVSGNHDDDFLSNGVTYFNASLIVGELDLDKNDVYKEFDAITANTVGSYTKFNVEVSRLQHIKGDLSTFISLAGQWANTNLDTSEKFFLGGPYSVSGYPVGQVGGDDAVLFHADLRYDLYDMPWRGDFQISAFYTYGWTKIWNDPYPEWQGTNPIISNEIMLQSAGIGFSQIWSDTAVIRAMLGKKIGDNDSRDPITGEDYDQSNRDYRFWLNAIYYF